MRIARYKLGNLFNSFRLLGRLVRVFMVFLFLLFSSLFARWFFLWLFPSLRPASQQIDRQVILNFLLYFSIVVLVFLNAFYAAARYIDDIYEINDLGSALGYLQMVVFGFNLPNIKVSGGKRSPSAEEFNSLERIGGPGVLKIERDNVVVIETLRTYKDVLVAGVHNLTRFDFIQDILSTEEQYEKIENIEVLTADGIRIVVKEVQIRFRIDGFFPPNIKGQPTVAYLPSKRAVKDLVYQRAVPADGKLPMWTNTIKGAVTGIVREHINNAYLGDLVSPHEVKGHSLDKLRQKLNSESTKERFKKMGIRFNFCNVGEIYIPDLDVDKEHLRMWFVRQSGAINILRAQSVSESFANQERGRAEGQAMLLRGISHALQEIGVDGKDPIVVRKNLRNILLTRTAQILEARSASHKTYAEDFKESNK
jgi:hypothetical protein